MSTGLFDSNSDMAIARSVTSFPADLVADFFFGDALKARQKVLQVIQNEPIFNKQNSHFLSREEVTCIHSLQ
jgi:hypothetical protein